MKRICPCCKIQNPAPIAVVFTTGTPTLTVEICLKCAKKITTPNNLDVKNLMVSLDKIQVEQREKMIARFPDECRSTARALSAISGKEFLTGMPDIQSVWGFIQAFPKANSYSETQREIDGDTFFEVTTSGFEVAK
jgi:hypothetical protein